MLKTILAAVVLASCCLLPAPKVQCAYCSTIPCYSSNTCNGCACLRTGMNPGQCVSIN